MHRSIPAQPSPVAKKRNTFSHPNFGRKCHRKAYAVSPPLLLLRGVYIDDNLKTKLLNLGAVAAVSTYENTGHLILYSDDSVYKNRNDVNFICQQTIEAIFELYECTVNS